MAQPSEIGTEQRPLRIAIVGSGPAGFHTAMALLDQRSVVVSVDVIERLPTPYGLVRAGVAPDHQKIKSVTFLYERLGNDPRFRFFGNVELGRDISVADLDACYDRVIYATGNEADRRLGIPGEHLVGCAPATVFVGWYNGHPDYRQARFDLGCERVVIVGNGNVALDVARILLKPYASLAATDIADHALNALAKSRVREVVILGRRGPLEASFTPAELKEVIQIPGVAVHVDPRQLALDAMSSAALAALSPKSPARRNFEIFTQLATSAEPSAERHLEFRFLASPVEFYGNATGRLEGVRVARNELVREPSGAVRAVATDDEEVIAVELVFVSVGSESKRIPGVPFDANRGCIANLEGRVLAESGEWMRNHYCTGWARTGAQGLIATQKAGAHEVVTRLLQDFANDSSVCTKLLDASTLPALLSQRRIRWVSFDDWRVIDRHEVERGESRGAPRDKVVDVSSMIDLVELEPRGWT